MGLCERKRKALQEFTPRPRSVVQCVGKTVLTPNDAAVR
ncbi:MAG: hypothetical protein JWN98_2227 [Abditibacteriota bacterium]|nr:hypothetical protein [Abditibacteriota bacterium]